RLNPRRRDVRGDRADRGVLDRDLTHGSLATVAGIPRLCLRRRPALRLSLLADDRAADLADRGGHRATPRPGSADRDGGGTRGCAAKLGPASARASTGALAPPLSASPRGRVGSRANLW